MFILIKLWKNIFNWQNDNVLCYTEKTEKIPKFLGNKKVIEWNFLSFYLFLCIFYSLNFYYEITGIVKLFLGVLDLVKWMTSSSSHEISKFSRSALINIYIKDLIVILFASLQLLENVSQSTHNAGFVSLFNHYKPIFKKSFKHF